MVGHSKGENIMTQYDPDHPVIHIQKIDRENNTVQFTLNGISITAVCSPQDDSEILNNVKQILIGRYLNSRGGCRHNA